MNKRIRRYQRENDPAHVAGYSSPARTAVCADSAGGIALGGAMCVTRADPLIGAALFRRAEHHRHALTIRIEDLSVGSTWQHET